MRFKVSGQNKDTGARMTLEFDAPSKADAERKATSSGMYAARAEPLGGDPLPGEAVRARRGGGAGKFVLFVLVVALAGAAYVFRGKLRAMTGM